MGMIIPVPFILWLIGSLFTFNNFTDQLFAFLGLAGIFLNIISYKDGILKSVVSFIFMTLPITAILFRVPDSIDDLGFLLPFGVYVLCHMGYIFVQKKSLK